MGVARVILPVLAACVVAAPAGAQVRVNTVDGPYTMNVVSWRDMPFRTVVRQQHDFSCGSAALATLLTFHFDRPTTEAEAFKSMFAAGDQAKIQKVGFSMLDMKTFLNGVGFKADGYRMSFPALAHAHTPVIVLVQNGGYRHFVVVKGIREDSVLLGDPALGTRVVTREQFEKMWNGIAFMVRAAGERGAFNRAADWDVRPAAPLEAGLQILTAEALMRELAPIYQITTVIDTTPRP